MAISYQARRASSLGSGARAGSQASKPGKLASAASSGAIVRSSLGSGAIVRSSSAASSGAIVRGSSSKPGKPGKLAKPGKASSSLGSGAREGSKASKPGKPGKRGSSSQRFDLPQTLVFGPGEPLLSQGECGSKSRPRSLWTALYHYHETHRTDFRAVLTEYFGLKATDSLMLECLLYSVQRVNRVVPQKQRGKVSSYRVSIDPEDRWTLRVFV